MIKVIKNMELPKVSQVKQKYPDLEVGDGFVIPFKSNMQYASVSGAYRHRGQKVACRRNGDEFLVKRIE